MQFKGHVPLHNQLCPTGVQSVVRNSSQYSVLFDLNVGTKNRHFISKRVTWYCTYRCTKLRPCRWRYYKSHRSKTQLRSCSWEAISSDSVFVNFYVRGFLSFIIPCYSTTVSTFLDCIGHIGMRPPCGWGVAFEHSPLISQITLSSVTLCLSSSEKYFMQ